MIQIYGLYKCFYCRMAKELCEKYKLKYRFYDINKIENKLKILSYKQNGKIPKNYVSIPIIFFNYKFIGGFNELENKIQKNKDKSKRRAITSTKK